MAGSSISGGLAEIVFSSADNRALATQVANTILSGIAAGTLTPVIYPGDGTTLPGPATGNGVATFTRPTAQPVVLDGSSAYVVVDADGPVALRGGAAGMVLLAGPGAPGAGLNLSFTDITASGSATDTFVITGGDSLLQTASVGGGHYNFTTGAGNDTIAILTGDATIAPGAGSNLAELGPGAVLVHASGSDSVAGALMGGGNDTVDVTAGNVSIDSRSANFLVTDAAAPVLVRLGSGVDTVSLAGTGSATIRGGATTTLASGNATVVGTVTAQGDHTLLWGGATVASGQGNATVEALSGNNSLAAGSGNDTLIAGTGSDTVGGASGAAGRAYMQSGAGAGTTFSFVLGQSGGDDTIAGFKATDVLSFTGFGIQPLGTAITSGTSTILTLSDGTTLTLVGATPAASQFALK